MSPPVHRLPIPKTCSRWSNVLADRSSRLNPSVASVAIVTSCTSKAASTPLVRVVAAPRKNKSAKSCQIAIAIRKLKARFGSRRSKFPHLTFLNGAQSGHQSAASTNRRYRRSLDDGENHRDARAAAASFARRCRQARNFFSRCTFAKTSEGSANAAAAAAAAATERKARLLLAAGQQSGARRLYLAAPICCEQSLDAYFRFASTNEVCTIWPIANDENK